MNDGMHTIGRWLTDRAAVTPDRVAIDFNDETTTYETLERRARRLADGLVADGLGHGDRVATITGNLPEQVELAFACANAGLLLAPLNPRLAAPEIALQLADSQPAALFVAPEHENLAAQAIVQAKVNPRQVKLDRESLDEFAVGQPAGTARDIRVDDDDPLLLIYTSGTTGRSKGAVLSHANCFWTNLSLDRTAGLAATDVVLQCLPQFHVGGWNVQPLLAWWKGARVVLEPGFDAVRVLHLIATKRVTTMMGVPATYLFLAELPGFADADLSSLRQVLVGGAPMPEPLLATWLDRGVNIVQGYGLTEAAPNVLCVPADYAADKLGSAGRPYPHVEVGLRDSDDGAWLSGAATGELVVRGPNVFAGYWRNPEATARAIGPVPGAPPGPPRWLRTGDIAARDDDGFYRIRDRVKDMYISGGENVYPAEVEAALHRHPGVVEAAVVGVPDDRWGEVGVAFVVVRQPVTAAMLIDHCRQQLARYKVPVAVRLVEALPRSAVDKILKPALRADYLADNDPVQTDEVSAQPNGNQSRQPDENQSGRPHEEQES